MTNFSIGTGISFKEGHIEIQLKNNRLFFDEANYDQERSFVSYKQHKTFQRSPLVPRSAIIVGPPFSDLSPLLFSAESKAKRWPSLSDLRRLLFSAKKKVKSKDIG